VAELADLPAGRQARYTQMFYTYAVKSKNHKYIYVGLTNNPDRRISQHNNGKEKTTRHYKPFEIVLIESFPTRKEARQREKYLKSGVGKEYLKSI
jgi:putative endonuclease